MGKVGSEVLAVCCAWCGKHLKDGKRGPGGEYLSHGICRDCAAKLEAKAKRKKGK